MLHSLFACSLLMSGPRHITDTNIILILLLLFLPCFWGVGPLISLATQAKILGIIFNFFIRFTPSIQSFFRHWLHMFSMKPSCLPFPFQSQPLSLRLKQWRPNQLGSSILLSADPFSPHHQRRTRPRHSPASNLKMASYQNMVQIYYPILCQVKAWNDFFGHLKNIFSGCVSSIAQRLTSSTDDFMLLISGQALPQVSLGLT